MLLVAPDPRLGISPERISRVRTLLDGLPTAPGVAVALPGGPDGELDALVLRPDGVLGLVPAPSSRRGRVGVGVTTTGAGSGPDDGGPGSQELAAAEIDRLLALADPTPTAPRQVVPIVDRRPPASSRHEDPERTDEDTGIGVATAARLVLTASAGPDRPRRLRGPPPLRGLAPRRVRPGRRGPRTPPASRARCPRAGPGRDRPGPRRPGTGRCRRGRSSNGPVAARTCGPTARSRPGRSRPRPGSPRSG